MLEYVDAFLFATVLSESGTEGRGGGAPADVDDVGVVLLFDPVRPEAMLEAIGADYISGDSPTEALVAPPLVSHGFGGDGADMSGGVFSLLHRHALAKRRYGVRC
jgi:hypothetical protein